MSFTSSNLVLRPVGLSDIDLVCRHRQEMFLEAGRAASNLAAMAGPFRAWIAPRLADGRYFGFIAEVERSAIAGIGPVEIDWHPHPSHPCDDRRGYVLNVFVEKRWRTRVVARAMMEASEQEMQRRRLRYFVLHATQAGRPLYDRLGWAETTEMAKAVPSERALPLAGSPRTMSTVTFHTPSAGGAATRVIANTDDLLLIGALR